MSGLEPRTAGEPIREHHVFADGYDWYGGDPEAAKEQFLWLLGRGIEDIRWYLNTFEDDDDLDGEEYLVAALGDFPR